MHLLLITYLLTIPPSLPSAVPDLDTHEEEKWFHVKRFESEKGIRDFRWDNSGKVGVGKKKAKGSFFSAEKKEYKMKKRVLASHEVSLSLSLPLSFSLSLSF